MSCRRWRWWMKSRRRDFSRNGAYLSLNILPKRLGGGQHLMLRSSLGVHASREIFRLTFLRNDEPVDVRFTADPVRLKVEAESGGGAVTMVFADPDLLWIRGEGLALRLESAVSPTTGRIQYGFPAGDGDWILNCPANQQKLLARALRGSLAVESLNVQEIRAVKRGLAPDDRPMIRVEFGTDDGGRFAAVFHDFQTTPTSSSSAPITGPAHFSVVPAIPPSSRRRSTSWRPMASASPTPTASAPSAYPPGAR